MVGDVWTLILAAGAGTRLSSLTTTAGGLSVPKQFCSLRGGASLLEEALARAETVTQRHRVLAVVADHHRRWWEGPLWPLPPNNVIVQPENRGTASGLLLPLLHLMRRDPQATVVVLPADHYVRDEATLSDTLRLAGRLARADRKHVYLLGLEPDEPDPELGYIVPDMRSGAASVPVKQFVEKPRIDAARGLIEAGALLNMFIIAASASALIELYAQRHPDLLQRMRGAVEADHENTQDAPAAQQVYPGLPTLDFSRDILEGQESRLRVLAVPACGWSDLGTPRRVIETLARIGGRQHDGHGACAEACLNLAEQHSRLQASPHFLELA